MVSVFILAVYPDDDDRHYPQGRYGVVKSEEARRSLAPASRERNPYGTPDATLRIRSDGRVVCALGSDILRSNLGTDPDLLRVCGSREENAGSRRRKRPARRRMETPW